MASLLVSGEVPSTIFENARPGDWIGSLSLSTAQEVLEVALTGPSARLFEAKLDKLSGRITILPAMVFDREAYSATADPVLEFSLSLCFDTGWQDAGQSWSVTLLGLDDTPPRRVVFATGGWVLENDVGAEIGRIQGSDQDTPTSQLSYRVVWPDEADFEIVNGNLLKLREGKDLLLLGGTVRQVMIEVSDGKQEATFLLDIPVLNTTDEDTTPAPPALPAPEEPSEGTPPPIGGGHDPLPQPPPPVLQSPVLEPPPPPSPQEAVQILARAALGPLGGITLAWQAEHSFTMPDGGTQLLLHAGQLDWLPAQPLESTGMPLPELVAALLSGAAGPGHWSGQTTNGVTLADLARGFLGTEDAVLAALPDSQMLLLLLRAGLEKALMAGNFSFRLVAEPPLSPPAPTPAAAPPQDGTEDHALLVGRVFDILLDRAPGAGDLALWTAQLANGALSPWQLVQIIAHGAESQARHAAESDGGYVASLWRAAHDHEPDAASLSYWTSLLTTQALDRTELAFRLVQEGFPMSQEPDPLHPG